VATVSEAQELYRTTHEAAGRAADALAELERRIDAGEDVTGADLAARRADVEIAKGALGAAERGLHEAQRIENEAQANLDADAFLAWEEGKREALAQDFEDARAALEHFAANVAAFNAELGTRKGSLRLLPGVVDQDPIFGPTVRGRRTAQVDGYELIAQIAVPAMRPLEHPLKHNTATRIMLQGLGSTARPITDS
jgi:hypothetical protein